MCACVCVFDVPFTFTSKVSNKSSSSINILFFLTFSAQPSAPPVPSRDWESNNRQFNSRVISYQFNVCCRVLNLSLSLCVSVSQVCGGGASESRAEQCAAFDTEEFMGRLYNWEPFTEGER